GRPHRTRVPSHPFLDLGHRGAGQSHQQHQPPTVAERSLTRHQPSTRRRPVGRILAFPKRRVAGTSSFPDVASTKSEGGPPEATRFASVSPRLKSRSKTASPSCRTSAQEESRSGRESIATAPADVLQNAQGNWLARRWSQVVQTEKSR